MAEKTPDILDDIARLFVGRKPDNTGTGRGQTKLQKERFISNQRAAAAAVSAFLRGQGDDKSRSEANRVLVDEDDNPLTPEEAVELFAKEKRINVNTIRSLVNQAIEDSAPKQSGDSETQPSFFQDANEKRLGIDKQSTKPTIDPADAAPIRKTPTISPESTPLQGSANYYERLLNPNRTMIGSAEEAYAKATASPKEPDQSPAERSYFFGYGGAGAKGPEMAQRDQDILGQDSYILGQSSGLTFRGPTDLPAAPFKERSGAARRARIRQGQFSIAEPKREFLRGQARAVRGATEIATQELLKRTGKTADEIRSLKDTDPEQFERLRAERDMRMQNLTNPDRPQFKAEDITEVYDNGRATGTFAPDVDSRDQRIFREQRTAPMEVPVGEYEKQADPNKSFPDKKVGKIMFDKNRNVVGYSGSRDQAQEAAKNNPALSDFLKRAKPMSREERQQSERADELSRTGQIPESANVDKGYFPPQEKPTTTPATNTAETKKKKVRGRFGAGR